MSEVKQYILGSCLFLLFGIFIAMALLPFRGSCNKEVRASREPVVQEQVSVKRSFLDEMKHDKAFEELVEEFISAKSMSVGFAGRFVPDHGWKWKDDPNKYRNYKTAEYMSEWRLMEFIRNLEDENEKARMNEFVNRISNELNDDLVRR